MESENMLTRANIIAQNNKIRLFDVDQETGLELYSYNTCSESDSELVKSSRGLVFHGETLVAKSFPYTSEYSENYEELFQNFSEWKFYTSYEGAILRMFYFSGKWFLSTHHKLNAFRSKWASKDSFGTLFKREIENALDITFDEFQNRLNKEYHYMFLLRNVKENRIVCNPPDKNEARVFHVGTFIKGQLELTENIGLTYPETHSFTDITELKEWLNVVDPMRIQGLVCVNKNGRYVKILHPEYLQLSKVRGNEPSLKFRYLQIRMDSKQTAKLYNLYPEMIPEFDEYEECIFNIANNIYRAYVNRFIKKNYVTVPKEEYKVINECHAWHLGDRQYNKITLDRVIYTLNKQPATNLNHMIRRYKLELTKKDTTIPRTITESPYLISNKQFQNIQPLVLRQ